MKDTEFLRQSLMVKMGQDYVDKLDIWYNQILESNARYIVFLEPKCYDLVLYMEDINDKKLKDDNHKEYLTAESFLTRCDELAIYYHKNGRFPHILLCEDFLIYGININHFLEFLKDNLCKLLIEKHQSEIESSLSAAIKIFTVTKFSPDILLGLYELNVKYIKKVDMGLDGRECNKCVNLSSELLSRLYNNYNTYTQIVSDDIYNQIYNSEEWKKTIYFNIKEYSKFEYVKNINQVKVIYSMRLREFKNESRLIPYVFLPNMDANETLNIKNKIFNILSKDKRWVNIEKEMEILSDENIFYEWLILLISHIFLKQFNIDNKCNIENNEEDYNDQVIKLMRNYNKFGVDKTVEIIDFTLKQEVLNFKDLNSILLSDIKEHYILDIDEKKGSINETRKEEIKQKIENYLYNNAVVDEKIGTELLSTCYVPSERRSLRRIRGCNYTLRELNEGYSKEETEYMMAYFLQMLDSYLFSISSYPSKDMNVLGFSQFVKVNRQSLILYPLSVYQYIPLISRIERICKLNRLSIESEIRDFFNSGQSTISKSEQLKILKFSKELLKVCQKAENWNFNCLRYLSYDSELIDDDTRRKILVEFMDKQEQYVDEYKLYNNKVKRYYLN